MADIPDRLALGLVRRIYIESYVTELSGGKEQRCDPWEDGVKKVILDGSSSVISRADAQAWEALFITTKGMANTLTVLDPLYDTEITVRFDVRELDIQMMGPVTTDADDDLAQITNLRLIQVL